MAVLRTDWVVSLKTARRSLQPWPQSTVETVLDDRYILITAIVCACQMMSISIKKDNKGFAYIQAR